MIIKLRVPARPHAANGGGGWTYIEGVERIDTHEPPGDEQVTRPAFSHEGLIEWVDQAFGGSDLRDYTYEVWPQNGSPDFCRYATIAVLRLRGGGCVLLVATEDCFVLGESGQTVDRIH